MAAEDHLLQWLDSKFVHLAGNDVWSKWLDLLRLVFEPLAKKQQDNVNVNDSNLVDVEIFDDTDPNTFDETIYTSYKCYNYLVKYINDAKLNLIEKEKILSEFTTLQTI